MDATPPENGNRDQIDRSRDVLLVGCSLEGNRGGDPLFNVERSHNIAVVGGRIASNQVPALVNDASQVTLDGTDLADNAIVPR